MAMRSADGTARRLRAIDNHQPTCHRRRTEKEKRLFGIGWMKLLNHTPSFVISSEIGFDDSETCDSEEGSEALFSFLARNNLRATFWTFFFAISAFSPSITSLFRTSCIKTLRKSSIGTLTSGVILLSSLLIDSNTESLKMIAPS